MSIHSFSTVVNRVPTCFQGVSSQNTVFQKGETSPISTVLRKASLTDSVTFSGKPNTKEQAIEKAYQEAITALTQFTKGELTDITTVNNSLNAWRELSSKRKKPTFYLPTADFLKGIQAPSLNLSCMRIRAKDVSGQEIPVDLSGADLTNANLFEANLQDVNLSGTNLTKADLFKAELMWANLTNANLKGANIQLAQLVGANVTEANLSGADILYANLFQANLLGAKLQKVFNLLTTNFLSAKNLKKSQLPAEEVEVVAEFMA